MGRAQHRRRPRQVGAGRGLPGWAMLTIGLVIGLFVAFLVYLDDLDRPPAAAVEQADGGEGDDAPEATGGDAAGPEGGEEPRFEFYSILPELEVVVPEEPDQPASEAGGDTGGTATGGEGTEQAPAGRTYYLQAGSFQQAQQADEMKARIALLGLDVAIQTVHIGGERWHRVRVGPYSNRDRLETAQRRLRDNEIDYLVLRDKSGD